MPRPDDGTSHSRWFGPRARAVAWNGFLLVSAVLLTPILLVEGARAWLALNPGFKIVPTRTIYLPFDSTRASRRRLETLFRTLWHTAGQRGPFTLRVSTEEDLNAGAGRNATFTVSRPVLSLPDSLILALLAHEIGHHDAQHEALMPWQDWRSETLTWQAEKVARLGGAREADEEPNVRLVLYDVFACLWVTYGGPRDQFEADSAGAALLNRMGYAGPRVMADLLRLMLAESPEYPLEYCGSLDPSLRDRIRALDRQAARDSARPDAAGRGGTAPQRP